ncbi:MAG: hypothetical protein ACOC7R_03945, partial [Planctomycetota bacterium]
MFHFVNRGFHFLKGPLHFMKLRFHFVKVELPFMKHGFRFFGTPRAAAENPSLHVPRSFKTAPPAALLCREFRFCGVERSRCA